MVKVLDDLGAVVRPLNGGHPQAGVLLANELFDNLPFHRLRGTPDEPVELRVGVQGDAALPAGFRFVLVEAPAPDELVAMAPPLRPGQEAAVSPAAIGVLDDASRLLGPGYLVLFDYAADPDGTAQVHGYRRHRVEADVLSEPGTRDITAGVDMAGLARHAAANGHQVWGPISQRDALMHLGFRDLAGELRNRQVSALDEGRGRDAIRTYSARTRAGLLVDPSGLGGFAVLCMGFGDVPRPDLLLDGEPGH
jgi:SAM-dependent MidA family methyltransferase